LFCSKLLRYPEFSPAHAIHASRVQYRLHLDSPVEIGDPFESGVANVFVGHSSDLGASYWYQLIRIIDIAERSEYLHRLLHGIAVLAGKSEFFRGCDVHGELLVRMHKNIYLRYVMLRKTRTAVLIGNSYRL